jgi:hypothetical protein
VEVPDSRAFGGNLALCTVSQGGIFSGEAPNGLDREAEMGDAVMAVVRVGEVIQAKVEWDKEPQYGIVAQIESSHIKIIGLSTGNRWSDAVLEKSVESYTRYIIPPIYGVLKIMQIWDSFDSFLQDRWGRSGRLSQEESNEEN